MTVCPKCGYERRPEDAAPDWECPRCGAAYAKATPEVEAARERWRASEGRRARPRRTGVEVALSGFAMVALAVTAFVVERGQPPPAVDASEIASGTTVSGRDYVVYPGREGRVLARFTPPFARHDPAGGRAATEVIEAVWGAHQLVTVWPRRVRGAKVSLWEYEGVDGVYRVIPFEDESGDVYALAVWKE
jgi:hypothetical protein